MKKLIFMFLFVVCFIFQVQAEGIKVFVLTHPVSNQRVLPNEPLLVPTSLEILIIATPGEYEPGSFVLNSKENLQQVEIGISDLKSKEGKIMNSSCIDIKLVKCWYQDKGEAYKEKTPAATYWGCRRIGEKVLVPELLLNDDNLIKVDYEKGENFIKIKTEQEEKYIDISYGRSVKEISNQLPEEYRNHRAKMLVKDSEKLLPFELKENENKQVWLTIKVPENQSAGIYEGNIIIKNEGKELTKVPIKVNVLPFKLSKISYPIPSIYYWSPMKDTYGEKFLEQYRKEMENLFSHGITKPVATSPNDQDFADVLKIRKEVGIENQPLFLWYTPYGWKQIEFTQEVLENTRKNVKEILEKTKGFGIKDVYFYGWDEAKGERLAVQRPAWEAIHEAGGKVFVAGYKEENFAKMGDIQDLLVCAYYPSRKEAEKWHSKGHQIVCYANPQGGAEVPETYRRNYGILLWQYNYDGGMTWIYHTNNYSFAEVWCDSAYSGGYKTGYKTLNMVYPTGDGVIDTLQWEGYREGIDDVRYLNVLIEEVKKAKNSPIKKEAESFINELKAGDINRDVEDMDNLRLKIINYIMKLKGEK